MLQITYLHLIWKLFTLPIQDRAFLEQNTVFFPSTVLSHPAVIKGNFCNIENNMDSLLEVNSKQKNVLD